MSQVAEEREGVGFVVGGLYHHEDRHAEQDGLNEGMEMKPGDALEHGAEHLIIENPGDEQVQALKTVEADEAIMTEAIAGQHDDGGNPADAGDIAKDGGGTGIECGQWIAPGVDGGRRGGHRGRRGGADRLFGAAPGAIEGRSHRVSALAAKRHLLLPTLFLSRAFRQPKSIF